MPVPDRDTLVTYGRVAWRYYRGPNPEWGYTENTQQVQYPDHPINEYRHRVERLVAQFPILPTSRILVAGAGIGLLPETFIWWLMQNGRTQAQAQAQVAGLDTSTWIQSSLGAEAHPLMSGKVVNRSMLVSTAAQSNPQRNALNAAWGGSFTGDFMIIESVDESYTDAERTAAYYAAQESFIAAGRSRANVIHIAAPDWDGRGYWTFADVPLPDGGTERVWTWNLWPAGQGGAPPKTLDEWAATRPQHSWVSYYGNMQAIVGTG